jgi:heme/copper-type cytochrome/quinol oxidase subunit 2
MVSYVVNFIFLSFLISYTKQKGFIMEIVTFLIYIVMFVIVFILSFASVKYFITMWKFKNRKKDGSEDDEFERFD